MVNYCSEDIVFSITMVQDSMTFLSLTVKNSVKDARAEERSVYQGLCWILSIKFQEHSSSFREPEIEFSRSVCKKISMPYIVFQCFLRC